MPMKWKRGLALALAALLALSPAALCANGEPWYAEAEQFIYREGLMNGVAEGFAPDALATRAAVFQALWNLEGQPYPTKPFFYSDVTASDWYGPAASWAKEAGLASGDQNRAFRGQATITRAELATIFARYLLQKGFPEISLPQGTAFSDLDQVPSWAYEGMMLCAAYGIITGDEGQLMPNATATQAELAMMLMTLSRLVPPARPTAEVYIEGLLRASYLGEFDESYLKLSGLTEAAARRSYEKRLRQAADYFLLIYNVEYPTDEMRTALQDIYAQVYQHLEFQVTSSAEAEDGFWSVELSVAPLDIIRITDAALSQTMAPFYAKYPLEVQLAMTDREYRVMDKEWAELLIALFRSKLPYTGSLESQTVLLQPELDSDGKWTLTEETLEDLDGRIIQYFPPDDQKS